MVRLPTFPAPRSAYIGNRSYQPRVYYKTAYNNTIRCIDLKDIDFSRVEYGSYPLDKVREQPIEMIRVEVDTIISIAWPFYRVTLNTFRLDGRASAVAEFTHRRPAFRIATIP